MVYFFYGTVFSNKAALPSQSINLKTLSNGKIIDEKYLLNTEQS